MQSQFRLLQTIVFHKLTDLCSRLTTNKVSVHFVCSSFSGTAKEIFDKAMNENISKVDPTSIPSEKHFSVRFVKALRFVWIFERKKTS